MNYLLKLNIKGAQSVTFALTGKIKIMNTQLLEKPASQPKEESIIALSGITWDRFKFIQAGFDGIKSVKLTYLAGVLEIMSPLSRKHERVKSTLSLLLEAYMRTKGIRFYVLGGFTIEETEYSSAQPDESYCIDTDQEIPDIVIEVIITSGTINKRELYKPKGIPEIWFWKSNQLRVFHLKDGEYQEVARSEFFPDLELDLLRRYIAHPDQYDAVQEFEALIQSDSISQNS